MTTDVMTGPWLEPAIVDTDAIALAVIRFEGMRIEACPPRLDFQYGPVMVGPGRGTASGRRGARRLRGRPHGGVRRGDRAYDPASVRRRGARRRARHRVRAACRAPATSPTSALAMDELAAWGRFMGWVASQGSPTTAMARSTSPNPPRRRPEPPRSDLFLTLR